MTPPLARADLEEVLAATASLWEEMRGERLFLTGGTGFFGCWLVESFLHANQKLDLQARVAVLTRDPAGFASKCPHLVADPALSLHAGDVRTFAFPSGDFRFVIHAATEASAKQLAEAPEEMRSTIVQGTRRVLDFAAGHGTRKLLLTSSGAVYGPQTGSVSEDDATQPTTAYGQGKLAAETMCAHALEIECKIARCFAFVGPHLPVDAHFAAGNFLADALACRPIRITSDGTAIRSYLYTSDLAIWLWTILFRAPAVRPFNVGSEHPVDIRTLAQTIAATVNSRTEILIASPPDPHQPPHRYVPSTTRGQSELGLRQTVSLEDALRRTAAWHRLK